MIQRWRPWLILTTLTLALSSCLGTETGNPRSPIEGPAGNSVPSDDPGGGLGGDTVKASELIQQKLCLKLIECNPLLTPAACLAGTALESNVDTELGLESGAYPTFTAIIAAEKNATLAENSTAVAACVTAINGLTCTDSLVQGGYQSSAVDPFLGVAAMIPTAAGSCPDVF